MPVTLPLKDKYSVESRFKSLNLSTLHTLFVSAREGVEPEIFYDFAEAIKMSEKMLAGLLNISARTISNYKKTQKKLDPVSGEHLLKLISLYKKGEYTFGTVDEFNYWLDKPFWKSNETPRTWINTPGGVDLIKEELDRLAEGYPV